ncbi:acireductone synthase [Streptomyces sp. NPDC008125]|uniref:acireductone synthase n=1 Tax=Streptomyces sp. NPDC008125 TaxID=3364811 RepID=UPI0036F0A828
MNAVAAVVLDIEGTVGSASHVREVLFPFAGERFARWFAERRGTPEAAAALAAVGRRTGIAEPGEEEAVTALLAWTDADVKVPVLKSLQGDIWATGYADGSLHGHVYDDVPGALERWRAAGVPVHIYSSGSVPAQRDWFAHTAHGDLTGLLTGHFDLDSAGSKREPDSYRTIARALGAPPRSLLFLSDTEEELTAAAAAGWRTVAVRRGGDPRGDRLPGHTTIGSLDHEVLGETWQTRTGGTS